MLRDAIYGLAVGDALGVPYEFNKRGTFFCTDMKGHGTYNQPAGTWSDDTSMALATCEAIKRAGTENIDPLLLETMNNFVRWYKFGDFTPFGHCFDIGNATRLAIDLFYYGELSLIPDCELSLINHEITDKWTQGNGALMRIIPLAYIDCSDEDIKKFAHLTHMHSNVDDCCINYIHIARLLEERYSIRTAIEEVMGREYVEKLISKNINEIGSSGWVMHTFDAAMYCLLTTQSYREAVIKAVNLGDDTDTTAAVTGALAGIHYCYIDIPYNWLNLLKNKNLINSCLF